MTRLFGSKNNRIHLVAFVTSSATRRRHRWGMHPPHKRCWYDAWFHWKSSPKYFCTAHYV